MDRKAVIKSNRVRKIPSRFSWIDHRIVRKGYLRRCSPTSQGLYLFLVTVGDRYGVSYYRDESIEEYLNISHEELVISRTQLIELDLIAYKKPHYQVLDLNVCEYPRASSRKDSNRVGNILSQLLKEGD